MCLSIRSVSFMEILENYKKYAKLHFEAKKLEKRFNRGSEIFCAPDSIAIFQEENHRWICTSGVFPLIEAKVPSHPLADTSAFWCILSEIDKRQRYPHGILE